MIDRISNGDCGDAKARGDRPSRYAVDGLMVNREEVWVLVGHEGEDTVGLLLGEQGTPTDPPLRICRGILDDDVLLIGEADPDHDRLLSDLLRGDTCGHS